MVVTGGDVGAPPLLAPFEEDSPYPSARFPPLLLQLRVDIPLRPIEFKRNERAFLPFLGHPPDFALDEQRSVFGEEDEVGSEPMVYPQ